MLRNGVLAIVQAGGEGSRMDVLTRERAKPALPFAGIYQLVDFPMSNLLHSGIEDVWLSVQYQANSLDEQISNGRPWDLDRDSGGFRLLMPQQGGSPDSDGFASGNADGLFRIRDEIAASRAEITLVLSSDHVYRFDYTAAIRTHRSKKAECTVVTSEVPIEEAGHHATVVANRQGRVTDFAYKPDEPRTSVVATEIFVYDTKTLVRLLDELHRELCAPSDADGNGLGDFGEHLLPRLMQRGKVYAHAMTGYWRDLGRPETYLAAHQDLVRGQTNLFDDRDWPIVARLPQRSPARIHAEARIAGGLVSPGCEVSGVVRESVLGPGVVVEAGARISNSVLFADVVVCRDASIAGAVVDRGTVVGDGARIGGRPTSRLLSSEQIALVGRDSRVAAGSVVPRGSRLEPGTTT
ncbi:MAG: glucose-1-phosphate adenylyltransferase family protein [Nocardioidaceae bacterium]